MGWEGDNGELEVHRKTRKVQVDSTRQQFLVLRRHCEEKQEGMV